jgi:hypothetical protein
MLDFEIAEMILLVKQRHMVPSEECIREEFYEAHESIHIKWTDSRIERILADGRGVANGLIP